MAVGGATCEYMKLIQYWWWCKKERNTLLYPDCNIDPTSINGDILYLVINGIASNNILLENFWVDNMHQDYKNLSHC